MTKLIWRETTEADLPLLAEWNHQLIRDEAHRNPMDQPQLAERMRAWLAGDYRAIIFETEAPVAYALFRPEGQGIYLRQLFVRRDVRSGGIGSTALRLLRTEVWALNVRLTVEALSKNPRVIAFYRKAGFVDYSVTLEVIPPGDL